MRFITTPLLGLSVLLLAACNNEPTTDDDPVAVPNTVSDQQPGDAQQHDQADAHGHGHGHGHPHEDDHGHAHDHAHDHAHAPPQHAPDGRTGPPQRADHQHPEPVSRPASKISIGDKVPDFEVTINGKKWTLSQLRNNTELTSDGTIVLTFWCSFCHSCRHVDQSLNKLAQNYKGKAAVIALDASDGETTEEVTRFAKEKGLTLPIALNASGSAADIFGAKVTTTTVVIDKQGVLRYCGQFGNARHPFAQNALEAVLQGQTVKVAETKHRG
jgi:thiol-disulfide isomerase/thioredoxin